MKSLPTQKEFMRERNKLAAKIAAEKMAGVRPTEGTKAISDPVVTPFLTAMQNAGFILQKTSKVAVQARACKKCQRKMAYAFLADNQEITVCAECDTR